MTLTRRELRLATVFLGGGRITSALAAGLRLAGDERAIVVYDRHPEKLRELRRESRTEMARDLKSAVERAEMLIVAVRPSSVKGMLREVAACGARPPKLCISLAAGIPLRNLRRWLDRPVRWVRAMPSPVCRIGCGLTPVCFDRGAAKKIVCWCGGCLSEWGLSWNYRKHRWTRLRRAIRRRTDITR